MKRSRFSSWLRVTGEVVARRRWVIAAATWAVVVFVVWRWAVTSGPYRDWSRDQHIALFQGAIAIAGFGAGAVALFLGASELASLGSPKIEVRASEPIVLFLSEQGDGLYADHVELVAVNSGSAVAMAWYCEITINPPYTMDMIHWPEGLPPSSRDGHVVTINTSRNPLFPDAPLLVGWFRIGVSVIDLEGSHAGKLECRVITDRGQSHNAISIGHGVTAAVAKTTVTGLPAKAVVSSPPEPPAP